METRYLKLTDLQDTDPRVGSDLSIVIDSARKNTKKTLFTKKKNQKKF